MSVGPSRSTIPHSVESFYRQNLPVPGSLRHVRLYFLGGMIGFQDSGIFRAFQHMLQCIDFHSFPGRWVIIVPWALPPTKISLDFGRLE